MNHAIKLFLLFLSLVSLPPCVSVKAGQGCYLVGRTGTWSTPIRLSTHLQIIHNQSSTHINDWSILPSLPIPYETFSSNSLARRLNLCVFTALQCFLLILVDSFLQCSTTTSCSCLPHSAWFQACHRLISTEMLHTIPSPATDIFSRTPNPILLPVSAFGVQFSSVNLNNSVVQRC